MRGNTNTYFEIRNELRFQADSIWVFVMYAVEKQRTESVGSLLTIIFTVAIVRGCVQACVLPKTYLWTWIYLVGQTPRDFYGQFSWNVSEMIFRVMDACVADECQNKSA